MEKPEPIIGSTYSDVWWNFHVEEGIFKSVGMVYRDIVEPQRSHSIEAVLLPCLLAASARYSDEVDDDEVTIMNRFSWFDYTTGLTVGEITVSSWWLDRVDLEAMWNLTKKYRPDLAAAGVNFAKELCKC